MRRVKITEKVGDVLMLGDISFFRMGGCFIFERVRCRGFYLCSILFSCRVGLLVLVVVVRFGFGLGRFFCF